MRLVVFGLTISSSWGNGHATLWRSMVRALTRRGHTITFYERDVPYYANARDLWELEGNARLRLYCSLEEIVGEVRREIDLADVAICTSFCPDGPLASKLIVESEAGVRAFYDMDTPVTLKALRLSSSVAYLPEKGLGEFDLVLSYTGGPVLEELQLALGARCVAALYGWVDPDAYRPVEAVERFRGTLSYLGTYAEDRQAMLTRLFLDPSAMMPHDHFIIGGAQYPSRFPWTENIFFTGHLEPAQHAAFYCSSRATLNITRTAMAEYGYCPSGRLFEASACGVPVVSDTWAGIESFFKPGEEIFSANSTSDVISILSLTDAELCRVAQAAHERTLTEHTADHRAVQFEHLCNTAQRSDRHGVLAS